MAEAQKIVIFQQQESGRQKIAGLQKYGQNQIALEVFSIDDELPEIVDDSSPYLPDAIIADLVLDFLIHPDLSHDLIDLCEKTNIPVISSGKKKNHPWGIYPPTCCGLSKRNDLGYYGKQFGAPKYKVYLNANNIITKIEILRGASCAATWEAARKVTGMEAEKAIIRIGLETQFFCHADPANWDPINGKSPVHFAGNIHSKALEIAVKDA